MRAALSSRLPLLALVGSCAALAACGKSGLPAHSEGGSAEAVPAVSAQGAVGVATKNTTRLGGADPASDAAAVARTAYPGLTTASRPRAVVLVDEHDWPAALAASSLASAPLGAPILYSNGDTLPDATVEALHAMRPVGAATLGGAQVIRIGTTASVPEGLRTRSTPSTTEPAAAAADVAHLLSLAHGGDPHQVIVLASSSAPALQMPAAGLAAESGSPILYVTAAHVPAPTVAALKGLHQPAIYLMNPQAVNSHVLAALAHYGHVTPIADIAAAATDSPVENANAVARFTDGTFGWGVKEPGHGLVFANTSRPLDAPASALLSAIGDYGPLLLLESPNGVSPALASYLGDIQPAYSSAPQFQPVHGAYNHGWLIGDDSAISALTQAEIDSLLEITPRRVSPSEEEPVASPTE